MNKKTIAVIGEGITEKYYIDSLKGLSDFTVTPQVLKNKASNIKALKTFIDSAIKQGYDEVYCLIDMDDKRSGKSETDYTKLKCEYEKIHTVKSKGISCNVKFIETERCTELWFLYYFCKKSITQEFISYDKLEKALQKYLLSYTKTDKYLSSPPLHNKFLAAGGLLSRAVKNSKASIISKERDGRSHTYSEMHLLIEALKIE